MERHCGDVCLEKRRHCVPEGDVTWEVDVYAGALTGVVIAEVEIPHVDTPVPLPAWIGDEVTGRPEYRKPSRQPKAG